MRALGRLPESTCIRKHSPSINLDRLAKTLPRKVSINHVDKIKRM